MSRFIFLVFAVSSFIFYVSTDKLIGKWNVEKIVTEDETITEGIKFIELLEDGSMRGGQIGKEATKFGEWAYDEARKILTFDSKKEGGRGGDGDYLVLELTDDSLVIEKDEVKVYLTKEKE
ncbi:MAG: hypothetical protein ED556_00855 [Winogradskyella sp.]|uniref:hypothetical protein n=1 Tax=Winogradskyella sp. TaxID=1883156 RepID=UPI000F3FAF3A|nr:hypothetical protein [Winogradskyella sp.]RNC87769.1 MAG: hypothetical protein ED556_00855 [Winogradskyella sp.]